MRDRRVCILRLPNAINLTTGFFRVCVCVCVCACACVYVFEREGERQTQGKKVNINESYIEQVCVCVCVWVGVCEKHVFVSFFNIYGQIKRVCEKERVKAKADTREERLHQ